MRLAKKAKHSCLEASEGHLGCKGRRQQQQAFRNHESSLCPTLSVSSIQIKDPPTIILKTKKQSIFLILQDAFALHVTSQ